MLSRTVTALMLAVTGTVTAQQGPGIGSVFVGCGYLIIEDYGKTNFSALLIGDSVKIVKKGETVFFMGQTLLEVQAASAEQIGSPSARGSELLHRHLEWETAYISRQHGWPPLRPSTTPVAFGVPGVDGLLWWSPLPGPYKVMGADIVRMVYVTAAIDDVVFVISAPIRPHEEMAPALQKIQRVMKSLRRTTAPLDIGAVSAQIKAHPKRWDGCAQKDGRVPDGS